MAIARGEITITEIYDGDNFYRAWADTPDGSGNFTTEESDRVYLGVYSGREEPTHYSQYKWSRIRGESAITAILSNDSHQIGTDENGNNQNYTGAKTTVAVFHGGEDDTSNWKIDSIKVEPAGAVTGEVIDTYTYKVKSMAEDEASVTFALKHKDNQYSPLEKTFTLSKNKQGVSGQHATSYHLNFNDTAIKKIRQTKTMEPTELIMRGMSITKNQKSEPQAGFFKIYEQSEIALDRNEYEQAYIDGKLDEEEHYVLSDKNFPLILTYTSDELEESLTYNYTDLEHIMSIKVYWYLDALFEELVDVQTIVVTSDGEKGDPGENAPLIKLSGDTQVIKISEDGVKTPNSSFTITGKSLNADIEKWEYAVNGDSFSTNLPAGVTRTHNVVTINPGTINFNTLSIQATGAGVSDTFTVAQMTDGLNAYTVLLSNESHTFQADTQKAVASSAKTDILAYRGTKRMPVSVQSVTGLPPEGMTHTVSNNGKDNASITFNVTTSLTSPSGLVSINLEIDGQQITKEFSYALSFKGDAGKDGIDAKLLYLTSTLETMSFDADDAATPSSQSATIEAKLQNTTGSVSFSAKAYNGTSALSDSITLGGNENSRTFSVSNFPSNATHVSITATLGALTDTISIFKLRHGREGVGGSPGQNAIVGYLTNESITLAANSSGEVSHFSPATGTFRMFDGTTEVTTNASTSYSLESLTGLVASIDSSTGVYKITAMTANTATAEFKATYKGVSIFKAVALSKSIAGEKGQPTYTWVKYAEDKNGSNMSGYPEGKRFIGLAFNKLTQTESLEAKDYQWSEMPQNIEIGGRNYWAIVKEPWYSSLTHQGDGVFTNNITESALAIFRMDKLEVQVGETYTVSFEINVSDEAIQFAVDRFYVNGDVPNAKHNKPTLVKDKWVKVYATFDYTIENTKLVHIYLTGIPAVDTFQIRNFKLEKGNIATDWTEAPEDVDAKINDVEFTLKGISESYAMGLTSGEKIISGIEGTPEGTRIAGKKITLDGNTDVKGDFKVDGNAIIDGTFTADKISTGVISAAGGTSTLNMDTGDMVMGGNFNLGSGALEWNKVTKMLDIRASKLTIGQYPAATSKDIDDIEVGGRNYFSYTYHSNRDNYDFSSSYSHSKEPIQLQPNTEYTFSYEEFIRFDSGQYVLFLIDSSNTRVLPIFNVIGMDSGTVPISGRNEYQFTTNDDGLYRFSYYVNDRNNNTAPDGEWFTDIFLGFQIEKGNIATDWTEAPEDTDERIKDTADEAFVGATEFTLGESERVAEDAKKQTDLLREAYELDKERKDQDLAQLSGDIETTAAEFKASFNVSGGVNEIRNSVGYASTEEWDSTGSVTTTQNAELETYGSGSAFILSSNSSIEQEVIGRAGDRFLSVIVQKNSSSRGEIRVTSDGLNKVYPIPAGEEMFFVRIDLPFSIIGTHYKLKLSTFANSEILFTSVMVNYGAERQSWGLAYDEIYGSTFRMNRNGFRVYHQDSTQYTSMSPTEFAGHALVGGVWERTFAVNGEVTEMRIADVKEQLNIGKVQQVYIESRDARGLAVLRGD